MALPVGTLVADISLVTKTDSGLETIRLADHRGKEAVVLLFFPAAFTGVCTQELCDVTAGLGAYSELGAKVYGISGDSAFAQEAWAKASQIGVTLLSDYSKKAAEAFDVVLPDLAGMGPASKRAAFVIDKQGVVRYSEETPTPLELPDFEAVKAALASL